MYTLISKYKNVELLVNKATGLIVAIANKDFSHITRACSSEELAKHVAIKEKINITYFGNCSEAYLQDDIVVAKCVYTGRAVKINAADIEFSLLSSAVLNTWKLHERIYKFNDGKENVRAMAIQKMNNMFVTYAGRGDAYRANIMMLAILKRIDPEGNDFEEVFNNLTEENKPIDIEDMVNLLEGLAAFTYPYQVSMPVDTPAQREAIVTFFTSVHDRAGADAALEFINKCGKSNQLPITFGDAEYIPHS